MLSNSRIWQDEHLPCANCQLKSLCKYVDSLEADYPEEVFNITITCHIKDKYKAV